MQTLAALCALGVLAMGTRFIAQWLLLQVFERLRLTLTTDWVQIFMHAKVLRRLAKAAPAVVVHFGVQAVPYLQAPWTDVIRTTALVFTIVFLSQAVNALLDAMNEAHDQGSTRKANPTHSIKSYVQLGKLLVAIFAVVLMVSTLLDRSPLLLLSGLGALSAVLMLVFKDIILSFVAGVQLGSNDMMRVGDWIEMPQVGADGFVIDIALNTVKVQNWDKTITTIPTWRLMSESFKNWRGMFESGGRRIRRSLNIDAHSIHLLTAKERQQLARIDLLQEYWNERDGLAAVTAPADATDATLPSTAVAAHQVSNLAAFKAYAYAYLLSHPSVHKGPGMFLLARTMEPSPTGVPLELYCYTNTTVWVEYEGIQGEIFDHLMGMLPQFGLCLYQRSSDYGQRAAFRSEDSSRG